MAARTSDPCNSSSSCKLFRPIDEGPLLISLCPSVMVYQHVVGRCGSTERLEGITSLYIEAVQYIDLGTKNNHVSDALGITSSLNVRKMEWKRDLMQEIGV